MLPGRFLPTGGNTGSGYTPAPHEHPFDDITGELSDALSIYASAQLLDAAWDLGYEQRSNVVEVYVGYLRRKVGAAHITTVRGMGYRFVP